MKIIYISSPSFADYDMPLLKSFISSGHEIYYFLRISPSLLKSPLINIPSIYPHRGIFDSSIYGNAIDKYKEYINVKNIFILNYTTDKFNLKDFSILIKELKLFKKINADLVHHIAWPNLSDYPMCLLYRKKLLITIHDPVPHNSNYGKKMHILRIFLSKFINHFVLLNKSQTNQFIKYYQIQRKNIYYAQLGYYDILRKYGEVITNKNKFILFFGRIAEYKGIEYLLSAYNNIYKNYPGIKLILAGNGKLYFDTTKYTNNDSIIFINRYIPTEELCSLIKSCEFVVCPYSSGTQSGVIASAFAFYKPVVATDVGGLSEMIKQKQSGIIVPPKNIEAISNAIELLLSNPNLIQEMSKYIKSETETGDLSWNKISAEYTNIYREIAK